MKDLMLLFAAGSTYVLGVLLITGYCWLIHWREMHHIKQKSRLLEHLMTLLGTGQLMEKQIQFRREDLREALVAVCKIISGPMIDRARGIYEELGFLKEDLRILQASHSKSKKIRTMMRIRLLRADLPPDLWRRLVRSRSTAIRWLAMETFITVRGKGALSTLFAYAQDPANERLGVLIHLFSLYASTNSSGLLTILDDPRTSETAQLALLTTLRYYPDPGSENSIIQAIRRSYTVDIQRCGIEALKPYASPEVLAIMQSFYQHPEPAIKQAVAYALDETAEEDGMRILDALTLDMAHAVRRQAIDSLCNIIPPPEHILAPIREEKDHPSHELLMIRETSLAKAA